MPDRSPDRADVIVSARWLLPVEPVGLVLENHAVAMTEGRITAVMPCEEAARLEARHTIQRPNHVLMPGLVNAHTHAAASLFRGSADDGSPDWNRGCAAGGPGAELVRDGARFALLDMLRGGITCFSDMYCFPEVVADLAVEHHLRASVGMLVTEEPTAWASSAPECFAKGLAVHDQYRGHPLVQTCFAPDGRSASDATLRHVRLLADELEVPVQMHVHESPRDVEQALLAHGARPLARLERLGLLASAFVAVHGTVLLDDDIALLGTRNASVVHCPSSGFRLALGSCPAASLLRAGVNLALGTDGPSVNDTADLFLEMRLAASLLASGVSRQPQAVPPAQALALATINGARSLALDGDIGSLVPGKWADMICVDLVNPAAAAAQDILEQVVHATSRSQVTDAWVAGRHVLDAGHATTFDEPEAIARASAWRERLRAA